MLFLPMELSLEDIARDEEYWLYDALEHYHNRVLELHNYHEEALLDEQERYHQEVEYIRRHVWEQRRELGKN